MTIPEEKAKIIRFIIRKKGMSRMLMLIADNKGIPSGDLIRKMKTSTHTYVLLNQAEDGGYIRREREAVEGRGSYRVRNYITDKGAAIVEVMKEIGL